MAREKFENRILTGPINIACKFDDGTIRHWTTTKEEVVEHIVDIVQEYSREGYVLTLRQLHYQFVKSNWIVNHDTAYKKLGSILDDCRYGGIIDWDAIEDRGRVPYIPYSVKDVSDALQDTIDQYRIDRQAGQRNQIELWTEKDALSGILRRSTSVYHIKLVVNKGYTSSSAIYGAYERAVNAILNGQSFIILYFGDHDPSGLDMVRDINDRLILFLTKGRKLMYNEQFEEWFEKWWDTSGFSSYDVYYSKYLSKRSFKSLNSAHPSDDALDEFYEIKLRLYLEHAKLFKVVPIGLTMGQIKEFKLPPNPTKLTDTRSEGYVRKFGKTCWEVDALKPQTLTAIVEENIIQYMNVSQFKKQITLEKAGIQELKNFIKKRKK